MVLGWHQAASLQQTKSNENWQQDTPRPMVLGWQQTASNESLQHTKSNESWQQDTPRPMVLWSLLIKESWQQTARNESWQQTASHGMTVEGSIRLWPRRRRRKRSCIGGIAMFLSMALLQCNLAILCQIFCTHAKRKSVIMNYDHISCMNLIGKFVILIQVPTVPGHFLAPPARLDLPAASNTGAYCSWTFPGASCKAGPSCSF